MPRTPSNPWPTAPRTVFFDNVATGTTRSTANRDGRIRRIATGVWTADLQSPVAEIIRANVLKIIANRIGPSVLVDRTAAMAGRIDNDVVTIATSGRKSDLKLPGVIVRVRPMVRHPSDIEFKLPDLYLATPARALVDNLAGTPNADRYLTIGELEDWLTKRRLNSGTSQRFDRLHAEAHAVSVDFGLDLTDRIDQLFATVTQQAGAKAPVGAVTKAAATGDLFDEDRLELFSQTRKQLVALDKPGFLAEPEPDGQLPFYEAYFSNYIEGTEFGVEEARRIVEHNVMPADRPQDAHDVLYTYRCVTDRVGRASASDDASEMVETLKERHRTFMAGRVEMAPGEFKNKANYVGTTEFVKPEQVEGTLNRAFGSIRELPKGLARAVYMMVVVAEVHPFLDGNGRAARLMMNAELSASGLCRIVVPTVYRNEYMGGLRKFTNARRVDSIFNVLDFCWRWTRSVPWDSAEAADLYIESTNGFEDSTEAASSGRQLLIH